jgi:hypothetical protein
LIKVSVFYPIKLAAGSTRPIIATSGKKHRRRARPFGRHARFLTAVCRARPHVFRIYPGVRRRMGTCRGPSHRRHSQLHQSPARISDQRSKTLVVCLIFLSCQALSSISSNTNAPGSFGRLALAMKRFPASFVTHCAKIRSFRNCRCAR